METPALIPRPERTLTIGPTDPPGSATRIADPAFDGGSDSRLSALIRHTDLVTCHTKSVTADDIDALKAVGISEDDIVRLSELIAFVNFQARVATGLRLLSAVS